MGSRRARAGPRAAPRASRCSTPPPSTSATACARSASDSPRASRRAMRDLVARSRRGPAPCGSAGRGARPRQGSRSLTRRDPRAGLTCAHAVMHAAGAYRTISKYLSGSRRSPSREREGATPPLGPCPNQGVWSDPTSRIPEAHRADRSGRHGSGRGRRVRERATPPPPARRRARAGTPRSRSSATRSPGGLRRPHPGLPGDPDGEGVDVQGVLRRVRRAEPGGRRRPAAPTTSPSRSSPT